MQHTLCIVLGAFPGTLSKMNRLPFVTILAPENWFFSPGCRSNVTPSQENVALVDRKAVSNFSNQFVELFCNNNSWWTFFNLGVPAAGWSTVDVHYITATCNVMVGGGNGSIYLCEHWSLMPCTTPLRIVIINNRCELRQRTEELFQMTCSSR